MALSEILNSNTGNQNWKSLYVYGINSKTVITQPQYYIEMYNSNAQGLGGGSVQQFQQFNTEMNRQNFNLPAGLGSVFTPSKVGFYYVTYNIGFTNTSGLLLTNIKCSTFISYNVSSKIYGPASFTTALIPNATLVLSGSAVIKFNGTTDNILIVASQSSGSSIFTGDNSNNFQQNKISIHFLHP